jgi:hypothetical protein
MARETFPDQILTTPGMTDERDQLFIPLMLEQRQPSRLGFSHRDEDLAHEGEEFRLRRLDVLPSVIGDGLERAV